MGVVSEDGIGLGLGVGVFMSSRSPNVICQHRFLRNTQEHFQIMENQKRQVNHLVNRLYKNFSESRLRYNHSLAKDSSGREDLLQRQKDILIPSLSKISQRSTSSLKKMDSNVFPDISIISKNASILSHPKKLFSKVGLDQSTILPDDVKGDCSSLKAKDKVRENKGRVMKKRAVIRSQNKSDGFGVGDHDLTMLDFISLIKQGHEMSDEFCYLKVMSNPYDLKIVDYYEKSTELSLKDERVCIFNKKAPLPSISNTHDKITISAKGVTYLSKDEPVLIPLDEWMREAQLYNSLSNLSFFKQYRVWKNFCVWKKLIRRMSMKKVSETLSHELLLADKHLRPSLLHAKSLLLKIENIRFCKVNESQEEVPTYTDFIEEQNRYRIHDLANNISHLEQQIIANVVGACRLSLKSFKEENRIGNLELGIGGKSEPLLIGDNSNKPMPYTEEATIKTHYQKLTKFMKLTDNMIIDGKLKMMLSSVSHLKETIRSQNLEYHKEVIATNQKLIYKGHQWFSCKIFFESNKLTLEPDRGTLESVFEELVDKAINHICKKHKSVQEVEQLVPYLSAREEEGEKSEEVFNLEEIVRYSDKFEEEYQSLSEEVGVAFDYAQNYSQRLLGFLDIYVRNKQVDLQSYRHKDHDEIERSIEKWKEENHKLTNIVEEHESSLMNIQTSRLKDTIKSCAEVCLEATYKILPETLKDKTSELKNQLMTYKSLVCNNPQDVEGFINLNTSVSKIGMELEDLSFKLAEVNALFNIIRNNKSGLNESMETLKSKENRIHELGQLMVKLRTKIDEATMNMSPMKATFLDEISKMLPGINATVLESFNEVATFDYTGDVMTFLERQKQDLQGLFDRKEKLNYYQNHLETEVTQNTELTKYSEYFENIYRLWSYKGRLGVFLASIRSHTLRELDIGLETQTFGSILEDVEALCLKCWVEEKPEVVFKLSEENKSQILALKEEVISYGPVMDSLKAMKDEILKEKEWEEIVAHLSTKSIDPETVIKLKNSQIQIEALITSEIYAHSHFLKEVTVKANHQAELLTILHKISAFWTSNFIHCNPYSDYKDVYLLESNSELLMKIDECLVDLNRVLRSPYVDTVLAEAEKQSKLFNNLQELLEEWRIHQNNWLFLEPLFNNSYFKAFPKELKAFNIADNNWRKVMKLAKEFSAKKWAEQENALQTLKNNSVVYANLKKLIPDFLRKKRDVFHRFYMVSDQELITMLSKCKDFKSIEPHIHRVFQGIDKFEYNSTDKDSQSQPTGLVNFDGETLPLKMIRVGNEPEEIFKVLEDCMKISTKALIKHCTSELEKQTFKRKDWIKRNPFQIIHLIDMIEWTKIIEADYLSQDSSEDLSTLYYSLILQVTETIDLIHDPSCTVKTSTLHSLLLQNIQYRDIVERLIIESVESTSDFHWQIQLRAYHNNDTHSIKQFQTQINYGYEFMTSTTKLPICPQTEKSRFSMFQALHSQLPLSLSSSIGIFQDLSATCGKNLMKTSCTYFEKNSLHNLIHGAYTSGSWLLFSDLKENDVEMMSFIAETIKVVRLSCRNKEDVEKVRELGIALKVSGTGELPEALRKELRSITINSPDSWFLLELQLYRQGLTEAKDLTKELKPLISKAESSQDIQVQLIHLTRYLQSERVTRSWESAQITLHLMNCTKNFIVSRYPVDEAVITGIFNDYLAPKKLQLPSQSIPKTLENNIMKSDLVRVVGDRKCGKSSRILDLYRSRHPLDTHLKNVMWIKGDLLCVEELLGQQGDDGVWVDGALKVFFESKTNEERWIIVEEPSQPVEAFFSNMVKEQTLVGSNQSRTKLSSFKVFFETSTTIAESKMVITDSYSVDKILQYELKDQNKTLFPYLSSLAREYFHKTVTAIKNTFKQSISVPQGNILPVCLASIIRAFLKSKDIPAINDRGIQKLFSWCFFTALTHRFGVQHNVFERFCKVYQEAVKFQHIKTANLSDVILQFNVPEGSLKPVPVTSQLKSSKLEFIRMMIDEGESLILAGCPGSLKSSTVNQLGQSSSPSHRVIHRCITSSMSLRHFLEFLINQLVIRRSGGETLLEPKGYNESRLSIFVDNINSNPEVMSFVEGFASAKYKRLWVKSEKRYITVSSKLTIHGIANARRIFQMEQVSGLIPVVFNEDGEEVLIQLGKEKLESRVEPNLLEYLLQTTSIVLKNLKKMNHLRPFNSHDLSKLLSSITKCDTITKEEWVNQMLYVYCSTLKDNREEAAAIITKAFSIKPPSNTSELISANKYLQQSSIRVPKTPADYFCHYSSLKQRMPTIQRFQGLKQIEQIVDSTSREIILYLSPCESEVFQQMQLVSQLCEASINNEIDFKFVIALDSEETLNKIYRQYNSLIDQRFVVVFEEPSTSQHPLEEAFLFFREKAPINRNHFIQTVEYYQKILTKSESEIKGKQAETESILHCYNLFKLNQQGVIDQYQQKSTAYSERAEKEQNLINTIKGNNIALNDIKKKIALKNQELAEVVEMDESADRQKELLTSIKEEDLKMQLLTKELAQQDDQMQKNTKAKDVLSSECASLKEAIETIQNTDNNLNLITNKLSESMTLSKPELLNRLKDQTLQRAIEVGFLCRETPERRRDLLQEFNQNFNPSQETQLIETYSSLMDKIVLIYDPSNKASHQLNKTYPNLVTVTDLERVLQVKANNVLINLTQPEEELSYWMDLLSKSEASRVFVLLDYLPEYLPCLNYQRLVEDDLLPLVLEVSNRYLKESINTCIQQMNLLKAQISAKEKECTRILGDNNKSAKKDCWHILNGKLNELRTLKERLAESEAQHSSNMSESLKYSKISNHVTKFVVFVMKHLPRLSPVYSYGERYLKSVISSALMKCQSEVEGDEDPVARVTEFLLSNILTSISMEHLETAKFIWCLTELDLPDRGIQLLMNHSEAVTSAEAASILEEFTSLCTNAQPSQLSQLQQILRHKLTRNTSLEQSVRVFVEGTYHYHNQFEALTNWCYLVEREEIPLEEIITRIFKEEDYEVIYITDSASCDQISQTRLTHTNVVVKLETSMSCSNNAFMRFLTHNKRLPDNQYTVVFVTPSYFKASPMMRSNCTKISSFDFNSSSSLKPIMSHKYRAVNPDEYQLFSVHQKTYYLAIVTTFSFGEMYYPKISGVERKYFKSTVVSIMANLEQGDNVSKSWVVPKLFHSIIVSEENRQFLIWVFSRVLADVQDIFETHNNESLDIETTISIVNEKLQEYSLLSLKFSDSFISRLENNKAEEFYKNSTFIYKEKPQVDQLFSLQALPVIEMPTNTYSPKSLEDILHTQISNFSKEIKILNKQMARHQYIQDNNIIMNSTDSSVFNSLRRGDVPQQWATCKTRRVSLQEYTKRLKEKITYQGQIKDNDFRIKNFCVNLLPDPMPVLKRLLEMEQKKTKYQNKVLVGRLLETTSDSSIENGIILSGLTLKNCRYDPQKQMIEQSFEEISPCPSILLSYGDPTISQYSKLPLFATCEPNSQPLMLIDLPFASKGQGCIQSPSLIIDNL